MNARLALLGFHVRLVSLLRVTVDNIHSMGGRNTYIYIYIYINIRKESNLLILSRSCNDCALGEMCPDKTVWPLECVFGTFANETKMTACTPCEENTDCTDSKTEPGTACPSGFVSVVGQSQCTISTVPSGGSDCDAGQYSLAGLACVDCPYGYYCPNTASSPIPCSPGYYTTTKEIECHRCPAGKYCDYTGYADPAHVSDGIKTCAEGHYSLGGLPYCLGAPPGMYCTASRDTLLPCPAETYSHGLQDTCTACVAGEYCEDAKSVQDCPVGYQSVAGSLLYCTPCQPGYSCATTSTAPVLCVNDQYSLGSMKECRECPAGFICPDNAGEPIQCWGGSYPHADQKYCVPCPAGSACPGDTLSATACADGTWAAEGQEVCSPCPPGYECTTSTISLCPDGQVSELGNHVCAA